MPLSPKQRDFIRGSRTGLNLASGSIRSGKSFPQHLRFLQHIVHDAIDGEDILISAKRLESVKSNMIRPIQKLLAKDKALEACFKFPQDEKPIQFTDRHKHLVITALGANDEKSEERVRGMTLQSWWPDELTLHPEGFIRHAVGRLSAGPRLMVATCNPDSKTHFVHRELISSGRAKVWNFRFADNPSLSQEYIDTITDFYRPSPIYFARYINGEWAGDPERQVVPEWYEHGKACVRVMQRPRFFRPTIAMDVGFRDFNFVVFGYWDFEQAIAVIEDELISKGETTDHTAAAISAKEAELGYEKPTRWSDTDLRLIEDLTRIHGLPFSPTRKDNKEAQVNALRISVGHHQVAIHPRCENLIRHIDGAIWNEKKTDFERTETDGHFDGVDAAIYFIRNIDKSNPTPAELPEWSNPNTLASPKVRESHRSEDSEWRRAFQL